MTGTILDVSGLEVSFDIGGEPAVAVDPVSYTHLTLPTNSLV